MDTDQFDFNGFLKTLAGLDRARIILAGSKERERARVFKVKDGKEHKHTRLKQREYISDLGDFLHFVRSRGDSGTSWPEAYLASDEWRNKQRVRNLEF